MHSMTGFGRCVVSSELGTLAVEIRSVNHRYCHVSLRLPPEFSEFEPSAGAWIKERVSRGQIQVTASFTPEPSAFVPEVRLNLPLARALVQEALRLQGALGLELPLTMRDLLTQPGVVITAPVELDAEARWCLLEQGLTGAWEAVQRMRQAEGESLRRELAERLETVCRLREEIQTHTPDLVAFYRERLRKRLEELLQGIAEVDEARIVQEAGILADRADISEELARLASHCDQFREALSAQEATGRRMDFLLQEMFREANTIAAKAADPEIVSRCVALKAEIERMREQVQNVE
ncbi:MAG: hypothetical protein KatS3mg115_0808 [Candidatus Poribacteria bacterium]|nr:MAG: hypothetical protein KatS3mg115_0808 [Candidatus Poribacteria bacterium]